MASANFSIGTSGLVSPSAVKQVTTGSYLDLASTAGQGWAQQYLPDLMESEAEVFGNWRRGSPSADQPARVSQHDRRPIRAPRSRRAHPAQRHRRRFRHDRAEPAVLLVSLRGLLRGGRENPSNCHALGRAATIGKHDEGLRSRNPARTHEEVYRGS